MWLVVILIFLFLIIFIITGILITRSAVQIKKINDYSTSSQLQSAHKAATTAAVITWIIVGLSVILLIVGLFIGADEVAIGDIALEAASGGGNGIFLYLLLGVLIILSVLNGIFGIIAAENIKNNPGYDSADTATRDARGSAIWAAVLSFASIGLIIIIYIFYAVHRHNAKKKQAEAQEKAINTNAQAAAIQFKAKQAQASAQVPASVSA